jgi:signal transduction histidine kinase
VSRRRRTLRGRLLIAMAAIAIGVLVVSGVTTVALARRSAEDAAISQLEDHAPGVRDQLLALSRAIRRERTTGVVVPGLNRLLSSVLNVSGGTIVTVNADGTISEGFAGLAVEGETDTGTGATTSTTLPAARTRLGARLRQRAQQNRQGAVVTPPTVSQLPAGLTLDDLDATALANGEEQSGSINGLAYVALPIASTKQGTPVLVLTQKVDSAAVKRARGFFVIGGVLALVVAAIVSYFVARRLTRPLQAMGATAGEIAAGDLSARVDLGKHPDDELAELARTLNGMADQLEAARHGERQFLLSVSHDLRTPLTSIRGYAEALTDGTIPASEEQRRAAAVIAAEADRLARLVADLLDLARIDAHQFSFSPRPFDVAAATRTAVAAFLPAAGELGIELAVEAPDRLEVDGDAERIGQIVANLVENALKYARSRITVSVGPLDAGRYELRVVDDGPGVDPAEQARVFERLFVSRSVPGRSVGTGLGLAIVGELAGAMGGHAAVDASAGPGATFVVTLSTTTPR